MVASNVFMSEEEMRPELLKWAISEAVRSNEPTFTQTNPLQKLSGSSQPPSSLEPTLPEARSLKQPIVRSNEPLLVT